MLTCACVAGSAEVLEAAIDRLLLQKVSIYSDTSSNVLPLHQLPLHTALLHGKSGVLQKLLGGPQQWTQHERLVLDDRVECCSAFWAGLGGDASSCSCFLTFLGGQSAAMAAEQMAHSLPCGTFLSAAFALLASMDKLHHDSNDTHGLSRVFSALERRLASLLRVCSAAQPDSPWGELVESLGLGEASLRDIWGMHVEWDIALRVHGLGSFSLRPDGVFRLALQWEAAQRPALREMQRQAAATGDLMQGTFWQSWRRPGVYADRVAVDTAMSVDDTPRGDALWIPEHLVSQLRTNRQQREAYIMFEYVLLAEHLESVQPRLGGAHWVEGQHVRSLLPRGNTAPEAQLEQDSTGNTALASACPLRCLMQLDALHVQQGAYTRPCDCLRLLLGWRHVQEQAASAGMQTAGAQIAVHLQSIAASVRLDPPPNDLACAAAVRLRDALLAHCLLLCHSEPQASSLALQLGCQVGPRYTFVAAGDALPILGRELLDGQACDVLLRCCDQVGLGDASPRYAWASCVMIALLRRRGGAVAVRMPKAVLQQATAAAWHLRRHLVLDRMCARKGHK